MFKSLAFSKIIFYNILYLNSVPVSIVKKLEDLQKEFLWCKKRPKIKHTTLMGDYSQGGLKSIDIKSKISSLHLSWIKRLFNENFHPWKNIPIKLFKQKFGGNIFYSNCQINLTNDFPIFYHKIAAAWSSLCQEPVTSAQILSQYIWFNKYIQIDKSPIKKCFPFPCL